MSLKSAKLKKLSGLSVKRMPHHIMMWLRDLLQQNFDCGITSPIVPLRAVVGLYRHVASDGRPVFRKDDCGRVVPAHWLYCPLRTVPM